MPSNNNNIDLSKNWFEAFTYVPLEEANYIRDIRSNNFKVNSLVEHKPLIEITTIHRSKGREADHVIVLPDMSQLTHKMSEIHKDEEHKCFYVACSRSRKSLFLMEPTSQLYYDLTNF
jgi:superfamily I DNA/RNA helicase